ncbi:hypothetical protein LTR05_002999 [Lithohypha guttulata]|uniref:Uncharacterized protein n=1 Tax=Lithohypha guttulata TaxID=1690604 RepID=A0AAN7T363_9EURO|nr:hypothetical protein LTR05_002999 [Lithohypha guttulata]
MVPTSRPDSALNINLSGLSPIGEPSNSSVKSPFNAPKVSASALGQVSRVGTSSPLHESAQRLFPKRTRELQTPTGTSGNIWGPPTSGTSTPLFEIPESPNQDGFPDLVPLTETGINSPARRGRAGTLPSRISPTVTGSAPNIALLTSKTSRPTPTTSPFRPGSTSASEKAFNNAPAASSTSALLSRLRAGSMPQRSNIFSGSTFVSAHSPFATPWNSRTRAATLTSISSAEDLSSPPQSTVGREDPGIRTLDYLGLAETSATDQSMLSEADSAAASAAFLTSFANKNSNRFRSFSVNTQKFPGAAPDPVSQNYPGAASGTMTPTAAAVLEAEYEAIQERVRLHNKAVQDFALNATAARPRARTAGLVDTPQRSVLRRFGQHLIKEGDIEAMQAGVSGMDATNGDLVAALYNLNMEEQPYAVTMQDPVQPSFDYSDETHSQASRSLWIGSIPNSTTVSTLDTIFSNYGPIESTRVLTHKNCGFVNFENMQDAVHARSFLNGKEIFPGGGPVRIGFAKAPSNVVTPIPGAISQSPTAGPGVDVTTSTASLVPGDGASTKRSAGRLADTQKEILEIVKDFGAQSADMSAISIAIASAIDHENLQKDIPPAVEPTQNRMFDAPRLRDIRKRIDNGQCAIQEVEQIALEMLPEIAELSSDYLGNTVVQKLFEYCSEEIREQMLLCIAPHLAEIGVHKNGTWAAQKIIDVCRTESQIAIIIEHLRPYTIPLFLDQFGNYVLQCCLRFGPSYNAFIFETMLSYMWEIAQGRFGARAMRACLESHNSSKDQQRMLAVVIALNSVQLATNANGALLLTWLLDTCTFPKRRSVLAPRLVPHLVQLCTHKVAYLTVLKVVNQRTEPEAREAILSALFFSSGDTVLEQILSDQSSGVTFVFKIVTSPFLDDKVRSDVIQNISNVLVRIKAQPNQGYKRLMDEVGLSSRSSQMGQPFNHGHAGMGDRSRPMSQAGGSHYNNGYAAGVENGGTPVRTNSNDSYGYAGFGMNGYQGQQQGYGNMSYQQMNPQAPYQNFTTPGSRNNTSGSYMGNAFSGYNTPPPTVDYRNMAGHSGSPVPFASQMSPMVNHNGFTQGYNAQQMQGNMYNYGNNGVQQSMYGYSPQMQPIHAGGRGRRR